MSKIKELPTNFFNDVSPLRFFVFTAAVFGLIFLVITPPFQTPDEPVHFLRAYQVSEGTFDVQKYGNSAGGMLPASLGKTLDVVGVQDIRFQPLVKYNIRSTKQAISIKENPNNKSFYDFSATAYYPAISYLPQSIGILFARLAHLPPILMMYLARLMVLLTWIILIALSIKLMPRKKWALVAIGLLPMTLFQATSLSADVMAYGMLALTFSLILKYRHENTYVNLEKIITLLVLLSLLVLSKQIMFVFLPLVLLLPRDAFKNKKDKYLKLIILILVPLVLFLAWMAIARKVNASSSGILHPMPGQQIKFIVKHPFGYLHAIFYTYFFYSDGITRSFIGDFGWLDAPLPELFVAVGYICLTFLFIGHYGTKKKAWLLAKDRFILIAMWLIYFAAVTTALYVYYDPVRYGAIVGIQGRYFIPLAILSIPILYGHWLRTTRTLYRKVAIISPLVLLVASTITIFARYYIHLPL